MLGASSLNATTMEAMTSVGSGRCCWGGGPAWWEGCLARQSGGQLQPQQFGPARGGALCGPAIIIISKPGTRF